MTIGRKTKPLNVKVYMKTDNGNIVPWESLTEAEKEYYRSEMNKNLSSRMSDYYSAHPEEYAKLKDLSREKSSHMELEDSA